MTITMGFLVFPGLQLLDLGVPMRFFRPYRIATSIFCAPNVSGLLGSG